MQPTQQQGRRLPSNNSSQVRLIRRFLVSICFAFSTQQMNSFLANGVISSHRFRTFLSEARAFFRSAGSLCTVPLDILFVIIYTYYVR